MLKNNVFNNNFNLIRIIAALQVLIVHSFNHFEIDNVFIRALKCFPGVPLFFFISGYLIGGTYIKNQQKGLKIFFRNRILRLYPGIILCTALSLIGVYLTGYFNTVLINFKDFLIWLAAQISVFQFYNAEFFRDFGTGVINGALWTISVELQFYILTPLIYLLLKRGKFVVSILLILSVIINVYLKYFGNWDNMFIKLLSVSFLPWIYIFLLGYLTKQYKVVQESIVKQNVFVLLVLYVVSMNVIGSYKYNAMNSINPISVVLLCMLVYKFSQMPLRLNEKFQNFINKYDISYGVYIYHMPIINILIYLGVFSKYQNIILSITLSIILGFLSWILVERKFLSIKK